MDDAIPIVPRAISSGHHPTCNNPDSDECNCSGPSPGNEAPTSQGVHAPCVLHVGCEAYLSPIPGVGVTHTESRDGS